jgi:hypothetical protein
MLKDLVLGDDQLSLSINGGAASFDYFWLRDNARDPVSFDSRSHQRELFTALVDPAIRPRRGWVDDSGDSLVLQWPDLDVEAHYDAGFLADFARAGDPMRLPTRGPGTRRAWIPNLSVWPSVTFATRAVSRSFWNGCWRMVSRC